MGPSLGVPIKVPVGISGHFLCFMHTYANLSDLQHHDVWYSSKAQQAMKEKKRKKGGKKKKKNKRMHSILEQNKESHSPSSTHLET